MTSCDWTKIPPSVPRRAHRSKPPERQAPMQKLLKSSLDGTCERGRPGAMKGSEIRTLQRLERPTALRSICILMFLGDKDLDSLDGLHQYPPVVFGFSFLCFHCRWELPDASQPAR